MIYSVNIQTVALVVGLLLIFTHLWAFVKVPKAQELLTKFPRARITGIVLLTIALIWWLWLLVVVDLGEFTKFKKALFITFPILYVLSIKYMDDFLSVRALGMLALLAARPMLESAYLREDPTRLLVVALAYAWIVAGLFWVGMPYILRDQIAWVRQKLVRWQVATAAGVAYGLVLVICAFTAFR
jgi:hypothetical protein